MATISASTSRGHSARTHPPRAGSSIIEASARTAAGRRRCRVRQDRDDVGPCRVAGRQRRRAGPRPRLTFTRKAAAELGAASPPRLAGLRATGLWVPDDAGASRSRGPASRPTMPMPAVSSASTRCGSVGAESRLLSESAAWQFASEVVAAYDGPLEAVGRAESTVVNAVVDLAGELAEHLVTPDQLGDWLDAVEERLAGIEAAGRPCSPRPARCAPTCARDASSCRC